MTAFLIFLILALSLCAYQVPKLRLENQVQALAQTAKIQGGLTDNKTVPGNVDDISKFLNVLEQEGFNKDTVKISLQTTDGKINGIGVAPLSDSQGFYIPRALLDPMVLKVTVQPKIKRIMWYEMPNYTFVETVSSERS